MRSLLLAAAAVSLFVAAESTASAQTTRAMYNPTAAGNIGYNSYRPFSARTYQGHAINHAQILSHYAQSNSTIPSETAKEHAAEVRTNLDKSFAELEKADGVVKGDKEATALLAEIKAHHKKADEICGTLEKECLKSAADGMVVADCCTSIIKELEAGYSAHDKLMKHLGIDLPKKK